MRGEPAEKVKLVGPQPVRNPVEPYGMETWITEQNLKHISCCRVTIENRIDILSHAGKHLLPPVSHPMLNQLSYPTNLVKLDGVRKKGRPLRIALLVSLIRLS